MTTRNATATTRLIIDGKLVGTTDSVWILVA